MDMLGTFLKGPSNKHDESQYCRGTCQVPLLDRPCHVENIFILDSSPFDTVGRSERAF